jgi:hypothetical protein
LSCARFTPACCKPMPSNSGNYGKYRRIRTPYFATVRNNSRWGKAHILILWSGAMLTGYPVFAGGPFLGQKTPCETIFEQRGWGFPVPDSAERLSKSVDRGIRVLHGLAARVWLQVRRQRRLPILAIGGFRTDPNPRQFLAKLFGRG